MNRFIEAKTSTWEVSKTDSSLGSLIRSIERKTEAFEALDGAIRPVAQRVWDGVNLRDRYTIKETFLTEVKNLSSWKYPALATRQGFSQVGTALSGRVLGMGVWKDSELHVVTSNGEWRRFTGGSWSGALASGLSTSATWSFINFRGNFGDHYLLGANGVDPVKKWNGSTVSNLANAPSGAKYIETHSNRVYLAVGNKVYFSALGLAEDWSDPDPITGSDFVEVNTESGKDIIGMKAGPGHLVVFLPRSTWELYGTGPDDYQLIQVADDIGVFSDQCVVNHKGVLYWADANGIYEYRGGARPKNDFSLIVQDYLDRINPAHASKASAGSDGKRIYFSFPIDGATEPNVTLEYDPEYAGVWYVWEDMSPLFYAKMGNDLYWGDPNGRVMKLGGTTNNGTPIAWKAVSVPFGSRIGAQNIRWYRLWLVIEIPPGSTCNVFLSPSPEGDSDWVLVKTISGTANVIKQKVLVPVSSLADASWMRIKLEGTGPVVVHELDREYRELPIR